MEDAQTRGYTRRLALAGAALMAAPTAMASPRPGVAIPGAWQWDVTAKTGLPYRLFLWLPPGDPPEGGWPVTYLLDGNAVFGTAVEIMRLAHGAFGPRRPKPGAVVAIGYPIEEPFDLTRRTLDLTPPGASDPPPRPDGKPWPPSGGADAFLDFVEGVVKPLVAREFPVDPRRACLFGHSFGGLFTLHCLFTRPDAFGAYVAASPSIWWNGKSILAAENAFAARGGASSRGGLLLTAGGEERVPDGPPSTDPHMRRLQEARLVDNAREMVDRLGTVPNLSVRFHVFEGENHGSVIPAALARGLRFAAETLQEER